MGTNPYIENGHVYDNPRSYCRPSKFTPRVRRGRPGREERNRSPAPLIDNSPRNSPIPMMTSAIPAQGVEDIVEPESLRPDVVDSLVMIGAGKADEVGVGKNTLIYGGFSEHADH